MESPSPYREILDVLEAGMKCAQSLRSGAQDATQLLESGQIEQAQARYASRGEILSMMIGLDQRLMELMNNARPSLSGKEWGHLVELGSRLRDLLSETSALDGLNIKHSDEKCRVLAGEISRLRQGKNVAQSYQSHQSSKADFTA